MTPLLSLDKLVWEQFEKITETAYKKNGTDKWSFVQTLQKTTALCSAAATTYATIASTYTKQQAGSIALVLLAATPLLTYRIRKRVDETRKSLEQYYLTHAMTLRPRYHHWRPLYLFSMPATAGVIAAQLSTAASAVETAYMLSFLCFSGIGFFGVCEDYFRAQLPTISSKEKK